MGIEASKRIVVKVGTSTLTFKNGKMNLQRIDKIARVLSGLKNAGKEVILVSSGAISVGCGELRLSQRPQTVEGKQAVAAVGQCNLMSIYDRCFSEYSQVVAQILLTSDVIDDSVMYKNACNTFEELIKMNVIPIVNANDTVSTAETEMENDFLSANVAVITGADALIIMTDTDGLYDSDPRINKDAKLISIVKNIDDTLMQSAGSKGTPRGTGGMRTKLEAARFSMQHKIYTAIISGEDPALVYSVLEGKSVGTLFDVEK